MPADQINELGVELERLPEEERAQFAEGLITSIGVAIRRVRRLVTQYH